MFDVDTRDSKRTHESKLASIAHRKGRANKRHASGTLDYDRILAELRANYESNAYTVRGRI